jgi:lysophospholipase L1-like esterase
MLLTSAAAAQPRTRADPQRFAAEVAAIAARPTEAGGIVFTGSSSVRKWTTLRADFPGLPVHNHGFGGSTIHDLLAYFDPLIGRHQPSLVVLYTGSNDLAAGLPVEDAFHDYQAVLTLIHAQLPATRVVVNSVKIAPSRAAQIPAVNELNGRLRKWVATKRWARYVDATSYLADGAGEPRPEFFLADGLHLNAAGYSVWRAILEPVVREEWARAGPTQARPRPRAPAQLPAASAAVVPEADPEAPARPPRRRFPR